MLDMEAIKNFSIDKSDWKKVKFGDVVFEPKESIKDPVAEGIEHVVGLEHIDSENIHLRRSASIEGSTTFTKKFSQGDVLFGRRRAYLKKAAKASFEGICSGDITVMRANGELLLPELLPFIVSNDKFFDYAITHSAGGLSPRVKFKDISNYEFDLPPKEKQHDILKLLNSTELLCQEKNKLIEKLKLSLTVFEVEFFSCKSNESKKLKDVLFKTLSGGTPNSKISEFYEDGSIPWLTTKTIHNDFIGVGEKLITEDAVTKSAAKVLPKGNIIAGTRVGVGKFAVNEVDISFSQDVTGLLVNHEKIDLTFLVYQLNSRPFQLKLKPLLRGTTIKGVTKDDLLNLKIAVPSYEKQQDNKLKIQSIKSSIENALKSLEASISIKNSLINKVF